MTPPDVKALQDEIRRLREINNRLRSDLYKANRFAEQWQRLATEGAAHKKTRAAEPDGAGRTTAM